MLLPICQHSSDDQSRLNLRPSNSTHLSTPNSKTSSLSRTVVRMYNTVAHVSTGKRESCKISLEVPFFRINLAGIAKRYEKYAKKGG